MPRTKYAQRVQEEIENEEIIKKEEKIESIKAKKKVDAEDGILCRSVTVGGLCLTGIKSGMFYRWTEYGDETEVEYRDLAGMVRTKSPYIYNPYFIIDDEDFVAEFPQLKKFYDESYSITDLESILNLSVSDMVANINQLPNGAKETIKNIASTQIAEGRLDSVKKIKALDEIFGTELNLLASLFE